MRIATALREKILSGKYAPGQRLPSESSLVRQHGVSRPTAERALRELVSAGLIERRPGSGSFVINQPTAAIERRTLGLMIPHREAMETFGTICRQLASLARAQNMDVVWDDNTSVMSLFPETQAQQDENGQASQLCSDYAARKLAGVFFAPLEASKKHTGINHRIVSRLARAGIATVLIGRDIETFPRRSALDVVATDNFFAGYTLASHLLKLGCRRLAVFTRSRFEPAAAARIAGVNEALRRANIDAGNNVIEGDFADATLVGNNFTGKKWDACICAADRVSAQLLQALIRSGIRVPDDLRVAGFDDANYATLLGVPLTTVHLSGDEMAAVAFDAMMRRIDNPSAAPCAFLLSPSLVVRESCGTPSMHR